MKAFSKKDDDGRVKTSYYELDYTPYTYSFLYCDEDESYAKNNDDLLRKVTLPGGSYLLYGYDDLLRRPYAKTYTSSGVLVNDTLVRFTANGEYSTNLISSYRIGNTTAGERVFTYTYDAMGNISQINEGDDDAQSAAHKYIYDEQNQLVVDVDYSAGCTRVYVYDNYGNIRSKAELEGTGYTSYLSAYTAMTDANTDTYTYGDSTWLDLLTAYNGNSITYDASGNPLTYYNGMTFTWGNVRQLFSLVKSDGTQVSYKYNMDGIRTEKTVGSVKTTYTVAGSMILREKCGNTTYDYYYDESGSVVGMKAGNNCYYFGKNAQGDICAVYDGTGAQVASLTYDAYGNTVSVTNPNGLYIPFRYRGYYFDEETGFYYLQSRYYDPETGRFINADDVGYLGESNYLNLFAYCGNNPVNKADRTGNAAYWLVNSEGAANLGHAALLLQGSKGLWWYVSFQGRIANSFIGEGFGFTDMQVRFVRVLLFDPNNTNSGFEFLIVSPVGIHGEVSWEVVSEYDNVYYIPGDFSQGAIKLALYYHIHVPEYELTGQNCAWLALRILQESTSGDTWQRIEDILWESNIDHNSGRTVVSRRTLIPRAIRINFLFGIE